MTIVTTYPICILLQCIVSRTNKTFKNMKNNKIRVCFDNNNTNFRQPRLQSQHVQQNEQITPVS